MQIIKYFFAAAAVILFASCKDDITAHNPDQENLIPNPSFEENGNPTLRGWNTNGLINFYNDTPPGGGEYSAGIEANWGPPYNISFSLGVSAGPWRCNFSCWSKTEWLPSEISVYLKGDSLILIASAVIQDSIWKNYNLTGSFTATRGDSVKIILNGASSQLIASKTFYDNCFLQIK